MRPKIRHVLIKSLATQLRSPPSQGSVLWVMRMEEAEGLSVHNWISKHRDKRSLCIVTKLQSIKHKTEWLVMDESRSITKSNRSHHPSRKRARLSFWPNSKISWLLQLSAWIQGAVVAPAKTPNPTGEAAPFVWSMKINIRHITPPVIWHDTHHTALWIVLAFMCRLAYRKGCFHHIIFGVLEIPMTVISCGELIKWMLIMIQLPE